MDELKYLNELFFLLPGFISVEIVFIFTSYTKPAPFERILQALVVTTLIRALVIFTEYAFCGQKL